MAIDDLNATTEEVKSKNCLSCGVSFEWRGNKKYCSVACQKRDSRKRIVRSVRYVPYIENCIVCNGPFTKTRDDHKCCSKTCRRKRYSGTPVESPKKRGKINNIAGMRFGKLLVVEEAGRKFGGVLWKCRCDCGKEVLARASSLMCGDKKSCNGKGECHHAWKGGYKNIGTIAWACKRLNSLKIQSKVWGYAEPIFDHERVIRMWKESDSCCSCCGERTSQLSLDHCHQSGIIRGFICGNCNTALGFAKDCVYRLQKCIDYLEKAKSKP